MKRRRSFSSSTMMMRCFCVVRRSISASHWTAMETGTITRLPTLR